MRTEVAGAATEQVSDRSSEKTEPVGLFGSRSVSISTSKMVHAGEVPVTDAIERSLNRFDAVGKLFSAYHIKLADN